LKKDIYRLPAFFDAGETSDIYFHFYATDLSSIKNKVCFSKNVLCLLQQGQKEVYGPMGSVTIDNRHMLLLTAGSVLMSESTMENDQFKSILIFFSDKFLVDFCTRHRVNTGKGKNTTGILTLEKDRFMFNFQASLELLEAMPSDERLLSVKLEEVLLYLLQRFPDTISSFLHEALLLQPLLKLKQVVLHNIDKNLTVEEVAFLCNMSMSTFKRHFAEVFNTSPGKYFSAHKMKTAQSMLKVGKRPSDIYLQLGYENLPAFSTEFKKHFGVSPSQYQKEIELPAKVFDPIA